MTGVKDRVRGIRDTLQPGYLLGRLANAGAGPAQQIPMSQLGIGGANSQIGYSDNETPTGTVNGVNTVFSLSKSPSPAGSLILVLEASAGGGTVQIQGVDYTLSGTTITYTTAPAGGSAHRAWYRF